MHSLDCLKSVCVAIVLVRSCRWAWRMMRTGAETTLSRMQKAWWPTGNRNEQEPIPCLLAFCDIRTA
jgi:hypothetical protein